MGEGRSSVRAGGHVPELELPDGDGVAHLEPGAQSYVGGVQEADESMMKQRCTFTQIKL